LQLEILRTLSLFEPKKAEGFKKIRVGRDNDGGYVMLDDFTQASKALSLGIADDDSWDLEMVSRGMRVHQYDHSIPCAPTQHDHLTFYQIKIRGRFAAGSTTLEEALQSLSSDPVEGVVLKMDIEGSEWEVLANAQSDTLRRFSQIVCEFHGLHLIDKPANCALFRHALSNLNTSHQCIHVHANNNGELCNIDNVPVPQVLEVTYANRMRYKFSTTDEIFPTPIDQPNKKEVPDIFLGSFKFRRFDDEISKGRRE
jgi:FkbM family methyltransferase